MLGPASSRCPEDAPHLAACTGTKITQISDESATNRANHHRKSRKSARKSRESLTRESQTNQTQTRMIFGVIRVICRADSRDLRDLRDSSPPSGRGLCRRRTTSVARARNQGQQAVQAHVRHTAAPPQGEVGPPSGFTVNAPPGAANFPGEARPGPEVGRPPAA